MGTKDLGKAKKNKADEFYTQLPDIEAEMRHYKDQFRGKTIFCNCDDPEESNFWKYFELNFEHLGIKKLISTHYETTKPSYKLELIGDIDGDGKVNSKDIIKTPLKENGDFRSSECVTLLKEADIIVTNPPFSLFREYISQLIEHEKQFIVLGNQNAITYKEVFKLIKENLVWLGMDNGGTKWFQVPLDYDITTESRKKFDDLGNKYFSMGNIMWYTNLDVPKRHISLTLYKKYTPTEYLNYDNYDAIEVSKTAEIPYDYNGAMGVPITFLDKFNPDQFQILGITKTWFGGASKTYPNQIQVSANGKKSIVSKLNDGATLKLNVPPRDKTYYIVNDEYYIQLYARIIIKRKEVVQ